MRYDLIVGRSLRNAAAVVLIVAVAVVPSLLEQCFGTCAAHPTATASTPACHHVTAAAGTRIGHLPPGCSHDHGSEAAAVLKSAVPNPPSVALVAVLKAAPVVVSASNQGQRVSEQSPPGSSLVLNAQSLPLRL